MRKRHRRCGQYQRRCRGRDRGLGRGRGRSRGHGCGRGRGLGLNHGGSNPTREDQEQIKRQKSKT